MMKIDLSRLLGVVTRKTSTCEVEGMEAVVVVASRTYDTTLADLWDAVTNPERIPRWLAPVSGDLKLGGLTAWRGTRPARSRRATRRGSSR